VPGLCGNHLPPAHGADVDGIDDTRVADGYVEASERHVRRAAKRDISKHTPGGSIDGDENAGIAGAQQPVLS